MNRFVGFIVFFGLFIGIYGGMNWHVFSRMFTFFGLPKNIWYWGIVIFFSLSYLISSFLVKSYFNAVSRWFYVGAASWFGIVFFAFSVVVIFDILNLIQPMNTRIAGFVIIAIVLLITIFALWNATHLKTEQINLGFENLKEPLTIVHLTDIHIGTINTVNFMSDLVKRTNEIDPDIVMITGDMFDSSAPLNPADYKPLDDIKAPVFFSIGNHEFYEGLDLVMDALSKTDVTILRNEQTEIKSIQIIGIDDPSSWNGPVEEQMKGITVNRDIPTVLMFHQPSNAEYFSSQGIDLHLAGHTHNGQIFPFTLAVRMFFKYINGLYNHNGMYIYTSPGTGTWGPPMRLGSRNQITVFRMEEL